QGIVLEGKVGESTGGRRPVYVYIDHTKLYIGAVKLLQDDTIVAILDLKGQPIIKERILPTSLKPHVLLKQVVTTFNTLLQRVQINLEHLLGVGVAVSGVCQPEQGIVINSVNLGWKNVPVTRILNEGLELPI